MLGVAEEVLRVLAARQVCHLRIVGSAALADGVVVRVAIFLLDGALVPAHAVHGVQHHQHVKPGFFAGAKRQLEFLDLAFVQQVIGVHVPARRVPQPTLVVVLVPLVANAHVVVGRLLLNLVLSKLLDLVPVGGLRFAEATGRYLLVV